jgi:predicted neuraminidase
MRKNPQRRSGTSKRPPQNVRRIFKYFVIERCRIFLRQVSGPVRNSDGTSPLHNGEPTVIRVFCPSVAASALLLISLPITPQALFPTSKPLIDSHVAALADGVERPDSRLGVEQAYLPILYPSSHAANLYQLRNGDILCVWFSGTWEGRSGVGIVMSRLRSGSHHWSGTRLIDHKSGVSYQNPVLFQQTDGTLNLYHTEQAADAGEANAKILHLASKDNGLTWSQPSVLFDKPGAFTRHPVVVLPNGTWLLPIEIVTSNGIDEGSATNYSATELSANHGKTWRECPMAGSMGKVQPSVVLLDRGRLLAFLRSRASDFIYRSTSSDGCTWTPAAATVLPNNNASVQLFRLRNGHLALAFDNSSATRKAATPSAGLRKPLSVALSLDEGRTWPYVRDVETGRPGYGIQEQKPKTPGREEYSYPSIMQSSDGRIYVAFTYRRQTIKVVSFLEDWIRHGGTAGEYQGAMK